MLTSEAQDPDELFDIVDAHGLPTGLVKSRSDVHRDGSWHRAVHVWVYGFRYGDPFLLFQRRSAQKDTWPGRLDATVGGHLRSGEGVSDALREVDEEIGVRVALEDLRHVGRRRHMSDGDTGVNDNEIQDLYLLRSDRPLAAYVPDTDELEALVECQLRSVVELLAEERTSIVANVRLAESEAIKEAEVRLEDFIPSLDQYPFRVALAAEQALRGDHYVKV